MPLTFLLTLLKAALVIGAVILFDHMFHDKAPWYISYFLPTWCWLLPMERCSND